MPSPIGHALAGLIVHVLSARDASERSSVPRALLMAGAATAPDLDLLFGFVDGRNHHQAETHSIGAVTLVGVVLAAGARPAAVRLSTLISASVALTTSASPPLGGIS